MLTRADPSSAVETIAACVLFNMGEKMWCLDVWLILEHSEAELDLHRRLNSGTFGKYLAFIE